MKGKMEFRLGVLHTEIAGGPYTKRPAGYVGVKMAAEIDWPCEIDIPTKDFDIPSVSEFKRGMIQGIMAIASGSQLYVGCMGGIGRTGLYLAGMAKVMTEYRKKMHRPQFDPVLYVRSQYLPHAVETNQQESFIASLDVEDIVEWWYLTQRTMQFTVDQDVLDRIDFVLNRSVPHGVVTDEDMVGQDMFQCSACEEWKDVEDSIIVSDGYICVTCDDHYAALEKEHLGDAEKKTGIYAEDRIKPEVREDWEKDQLHTGPVTGLYDLHEVVPPDIRTAPGLTNDLMEVDNEVRIERLEGSVLELDRRIRMQEAAREQTLKDLVVSRSNHREPWWAFWR